MGRLIGKLLKTTNYCSDLEVENIFKIYQQMQLISLIALLDQRIINVIDSICDFPNTSQNVCFEKKNSLNPD